MLKALCQALFAYCGPREDILKRFEIAFLMNPFSVIRNLQVHLLKKHDSLLGFHSLLAPLVSSLPCRMQQAGR